MQCLKALFALPFSALIDMHELSVAQRIVEIAREEAFKSGLSRVTAIKVRVGGLSTIVPEALNFCFAFATEDTPAAGAELVIEEVPAEASCNSCGTTFPVTDAYFLICPSCSSPDTTLLRGRELDLISIEGETQEDNTPDDEATRGRT